MKTMKVYAIFILVLTSVVLLFSCSRDSDKKSVIEHKDTPVKIEVHLANGFSGTVKVSIDNEWLFDALLSGDEYFAGPQAKCVTTLMPGIHHFFVYCRPGGREGIQTDAGIEVTQTEKFYIVCTLRDGEIDVISGETIPGYQ